jgi:apolipoprotein N-acyltransferase
MPLSQGHSAIIARVEAVPLTRPSTARVNLADTTAARVRRRAKARSGLQHAHVSSLLGGGMLAIAWLLPETAAGALLGWISALLLVYGARAARAYLPMYGAGVVGHLVGFHWVYQTVRVFGGFGPPAAAVIFVLFVLLGALQFLLFVLIHHHLDAIFERLAIRSATAVVLAELLMPRLFPWHFGHTQIAFTPFVQVAGLGGAMAVSFLMFWLAEAAVRFVAFRERRPILVLPVLVFGLAMTYGATMMKTFRALPGRGQEVVVVQGNATLVEKRDLASARKNLARIFELSSAKAHPGTLIVWPEGSVPAYIPADVGGVGYPPILPCIGDGSAFLIGSYAFLPDERRFNAAFAVYPDGTVPLPYFKRVLIPFGEYLPLSSYFPALRKLNAKAGVFTAGTKARVFDYPLRRPDGTPYTLKLSPLICYEDTIPALARESTRKGAELLVNITSDSWFGRTLAPHQHHLIAAFRAIENRRFLIRATNTGYSAIVDPLGRTIAKIPPFTEGTATARVSLLDYRSPYTGWIGDQPWWMLLALCVGMIVVRRWRGTEAAT